MLIHPWDAALDEQEWRNRPADGHDLGQPVDDPAEKADLLVRQLAHSQPAGDHPAVAVGAPPYGRCCPTSAACASMGWVIGHTQHGRHGTRRGTST